MSQTLIGLSLWTLYIVSFFVETVNASTCTNQFLKSLNTKKCYTEVQSQFPFAISSEGDDTPYEWWCSAAHFFFLQDSSRTVRRTCKKTREADTCKEQLQIEYLRQLLDMNLTLEHDSLGSIFFATDPLEHVPVGTYSASEFLSLTLDFFDSEAYGEKFFTGSNKGWTRTARAIDAATYSMFSASENLDDKSVVFLFSDGKPERRQGGFNTEFPATIEAVEQMKSFFPNVHIHCVVLAPEGKFDSKQKVFWKSGDICDSKDLIRDSSDIETSRFEYIFNALQYRSDLCKHPPITLPPSNSPSHTPSTDPTTQPSTNPTLNPSYSPSHLPTSSPSHKPSAAPSNPDTVTPSSAPTQSPSLRETADPTSQPSTQPTTKCEQYDYFDKESTRSLYHFANFSAENLIVDNLCGMGNIEAEPVLLYHDVFQSWTVETGVVVDLEIRCNVESTQGYERLQTPLLDEQKRANEYVERISLRPGTYLETDIRLLKHGTNEQIAFDEILFIALDLDESRTRFSEIIHLSANNHILAQHIGDQVAPLSEGSSRFQESKYQFTSQVIGDAKNNPVSVFLEDLTEEQLALSVAVSVFNDSGFEVALEVGSSEESSAQGGVRTMLFGVAVSKEGCTGSSTNAPVPDTYSPTLAPVPTPSLNQSKSPSSQPSTHPTQSPVPSPTVSPTNAPVPNTTDNPTLQPSYSPSLRPSQNPTEYVEVDCDQAEFYEQEPTASLYEFADFSVENIAIDNLCGSQSDVDDPVLLYNNIFPELTAQSGAEYSLVIQCDSQESSGYEETRSPKLLALKAANSRIEGFSLREGGKLSMSLHVKSNVTNADHLFGELYFVALDLDEGQSIEESVSIGFRDDWSKRHVGDAVDVVEDVQSALDFTSTSVGNAKNNPSDVYLEDFTPEQLSLSAAVSLFDSSGFDLELSVNTKEGKSTGSGIRTMLYGLARSRKECKPEYTNSPTTTPTQSTESPTTHPSTSPTTSPSDHPSKSPTTIPSTSPTTTPSRAPTQSTKSPTTHPTTSPTTSPSDHPSKSPTTSPSTSPTKKPSRTPTQTPSVSPTKHPSYSPTKGPSVAPTASPIDCSYAFDVGNTKGTYTFADLSPSNRVVDNLCGIKNQDDQPVIHYSDVFPGIPYGFPVDLTISCITEENNGFQDLDTPNLLNLKEQFNTIERLSLMAGASVGVELQFTNNLTGMPVDFTELFLTVLDLDQGSNGYAESFKLSVDGVYSEAHIGTDVLSHSLGEGQVVYQSKVVGNAKDNPGEAYLEDLTDQQLRRTVAVSFFDTGKLELLLSVINPDNEQSSAIRTFMFGIATTTTPCYNTDT